MNRNLFRRRGAQRSVPAADTRNAAGGRAYSLENEAALAQYAVTGTFHDTFYVGADDHLKKVTELAERCQSVFLAKLAVYSRQQARMKDMPAYLLAILVARGETELVKTIFDDVCDNSKMLFAFVRIIRSGVTGRTSFGTAIKRLIQNWLLERGEMHLFNSSIGHSDPSMSDVIKMVHPRPQNEYQSEMFKYLLGRDCDLEKLPYEIRLFEDLKRGELGENTPMPSVPFRALTNCNLTQKQWCEIGVNMPWNTLRQSLVLLGRRGVYDRKWVVNSIAEKLADPDEVRKCNAFPFELLATWKATKNEVPVEISNAIQAAMETATENVPKFQGETLIAVDVSGSMCMSPITGRSAKPSIVKVVEGAALIACALLRQNRAAEIIGFDSMEYPSRHTDGVQFAPGIYQMTHVNPFDSVMTNVEKVNQNGGGTDCSLPFKYLNQRSLSVNNVVVLSDYESWAGRNYGFSGCASCNDWKQYSSRHRGAKLACVDLQPQNTTQVPDQPGRVINVGGWNDQMFNVLAGFFNRGEKTNFVDYINRVELSSTGRK